jgi:hypothetical protein
LADGRPPDCTRTSTPPNLGDARQRPSATEKIGETLSGLGGHLADPPSTNAKLGHRFEVDGQIVDVLGPDGLRKPPLTLAGHETIEVPGGTQALRRCETVSVTVDGLEPVAIRRPSLLGAILLKARAVKVHHRQDDQTQDLILLLSFVEDPRSMARELSGKESRWLGDAAARLDFDDPSLRRLLPDQTLQEASLALDLLQAASRNRS